MFFTALQLPNSNSFHLERVERIADNNQIELHKPVVETFKNETMISIANKTSNPHLTEKTGNEPLSSIKSIADKVAIKNDEMKIHGKQWRTSNHAVPAKPLNLRNIASHPKRESSNHPMWHKNLKDLHKFGSVNSAKENGFNGFDVVVIDLPPSYSKQRYDKPRINTFTSPSFRYMPMGPSPSIFDFFLGLNSISGNLLTDPAEMGNEIYFQQSLENPSWNHRLSFDRFVSPATVHPNVMNGIRIPRDENPTQLYGKLSEPIKNCTCTCGERNKLR